MGRSVRSTCEMEMEVEMEMVEADSRRTALFVQGALGALALLVLLWKRAREHPQRPMLIWWVFLYRVTRGLG